MGLAHVARLAVLLALGAAAGWLVHGRASRSHRRDVDPVPAWAKAAPQQIAEAKKHGVPVAFENDLGMRFVLIPAGTFWMGSAESEVGRRADEARHEVRIPHPFYVQTTEVTNQQYRQSQPTHDSLGDRDGANQPVVMVPHGDAKAFARWVSRRDGQRSYRLPNSAEWEHACRAETTTAFSFGTSISSDQANYDGTIPYGSGPKGIERLTTTPAASFAPNGWGLYDMHGNVWEWCLDLDLDLDRSGNGEGLPRSEAAKLRTIRGGSYGLPPSLLRSASRPSAESAKPFGNVGFRLVSPLPEPGT